jgi:ABC-type multidrug transport system fused ATPase/permease subunit
MGLYFEHVLHLPMSFHGSTHSGRLLKGMLDGTAGLFWLRLSFFREKCVAFMALIFLLPLSLIINWRLGFLLILFVAVFAVLIVFVIRRTHVLQRRRRSACFTASSIHKRDESRSTGSTSAT